ncbi:hypothetical protein SPRG_00829 [Saprolegnia parasitica CBS 223.65]|uniref:FYVE-type domain-containing protein n=1 Tax=Saprolegnia parasitica (strain CBS 223.65) TaxID=695850 RepID=A0A067CWA6_SAPPC|nr:hypothetical protein SPRG_00829 [Saprolegnia parasitica CBS 223.65]KDO34768.1 hypothetical protein SPRG_00829 [Saprolegnia parasitica CBS 223.65]|eukprot:XP_012194435.1 hypothetical protein SPRG_00829 [Saprolegnia parasitica CBS 223.65]
MSMHPNAALSAPNLWYVQQQKAQRPEVVLDVSLGQWHAWSISQAHWVHDAHRSACHGCGHSFTFFRRKQHCRMCGEIICRQCARRVCLVTLDTKRQRKPQQRHIKVCPPCYASTQTTRISKLPSPAASPNPFFATTPTIPLLEEKSLASSSFTASTCPSSPYCSLKDDAPPSIEDLWVHSNEQARLQALWQLHILDSPREATYDTICSLLGDLTNCPIAYISFMDAHRQWFKASVGLFVPEVPREASLCASTLHAPRPILVPDTLRDLRFASNPLVASAHGIRFYAGAPIVLGSSGVAIGTIAVLDTVASKRSATLHDDVVHHLNRLARLVASYVERPQPLTPQIVLQQLLRQSLETKEMLSGRGGVSWHSGKPSIYRSWSSISEDTEQ